MPKLKRNHKRPDEPVMVPAGSADEPVDHTADSAVHGTENTDPQSPLPEGKLTDEQRKNLFTDMNKPGVSVQDVAGKYKVHPQRVLEIVDEINEQRRDNRK